MNNDKEHQFELFSKKTHFFLDSIKKSSTFAV